MKKLLSLLLLAGNAACALRLRRKPRTAHRRNNCRQSAQKLPLQTSSEPSTLVYGSGDYTRINPAMDEHCEINLLHLRRSDRPRRRE